MADLTLDIDQRAVRSNIEKVLKAEATGNKDYILRTSQYAYSTFAPAPYKNFDDFIRDITGRNGRISALELGSGHGIVAERLSRDFRHSIDMEVLGLSKPSVEGNFRWMTGDFDNFTTDKKYDLIYSIYGLVYGYNDYRNFFKCLNMLNPDGVIVFDFDSMVDPLHLDKANRFSDFLHEAYLHALSAEGFPCYITNKGGHSIFLGTRKSSTDYAPQPISERRDAILASGLASYFVEYCEEQKWFDYKSRAGWLEVRQAAERQLEQFEQPYKKFLKRKMEGRERFLSTFLGRLEDQILLFNMPLGTCLRDSWKSHPLSDLGIEPPAYYPEERFYVKIPLELKVELEEVCRLTQLGKKEFTLNAIGLLKLLTKYGETGYIPYFENQESAVPVTPVEYRYREYRGGTYPFSFNLQTGREKKLQRFADEYYIKDVGRAVIDAIDLGVQYVKRAKQGYDLKLMRLETGESFALESLNIWV